MADLLASEQASRDEHPATHIILLLIGAFLWFAGFFAFQRLLDIHSNDIIGGGAGEIFALTLLVFAIASVPAAQFGDRVGRARAIAIGVAISLMMLLLTYVSPSAVIFGVFTICVGVGWALINTNAIPYLLDTAPGRRRGFIVGLYYAAFALSTLSTPVLIENETQIVEGPLSFMIVPVLFLLSGAVIFPLTKHVANKTPHEVQQPAEPEESTVT
jgi:MFS family permease